VLWLLLLCSVLITFFFHFFIESKVDIATLFVGQEASRTH